MRALRHDAVRRLRISGVGAALYRHDPAPGADSGQPEVDVVPDEKPEPREGRWLLLGVVFVVASPTAAYAAQQSHGWRMWLLFGVQLVATALAFLIPQARAVAATERERTAEERELDARTDARATINDALDPVL